MVSVSVNLGSYNRILETRWVINSKNLFLTVLESEKSKIKVLADPNSDEYSLPG